MPTTTRSSKKVIKQPTKKAANKAKYQENNTVNTIVSVIGHPIEDGSNTTAGSVKVPRELLSSLSNKTDFNGISTLFYIGNGHPYKSLKHFM